MVDQNNNGEQKREGPVQLKNGQILSKRWRIVEKIGEGGCGSVYKVEDMNTKLEAALKVESNFVASGSVLKLEVSVLRKLQGKPHVCQLLHSGKRETYSYIVMTLLGESLNHLVRKCGKEVSVSTQIRVGINVLYGLKQIHDIGFVHRDLKPANVAIGAQGTQSARFIHILDFGLSRKFIQRTIDGKMAIRRPRTRCLFRGTTRYCSLNAHDKEEQSRVDDLWSLLYVMAELRGALPWHNSRDKKEVAEIKRSTTDKMLLYNSPVQLLDFAEHLRELSYYSRPNYMKIFELLNDVLSDGGFKFGDPWDWEKNRDYLAPSTLTRPFSGEKTLGNTDDPQQRTALSNKELGTCDSMSFMQLISQDRFESDSNNPLPQMIYNDTNNPFPVEDFDTNPLEC